MSYGVRAWYNEQVDAELTRATKRLAPSEYKCYEFLWAVIIGSAMSESYVLVDGASKRVRMRESSGLTS